MSKFVADLELADQDKAAQLLRGTLHSRRQICDICFAHFERYTTREYQKISYSKYFSHHLSSAKKS